MEKIYFIGICGAAMAQVAVMMKKLGYNVSGSDQNIYPPSSTFLQNEGIEIFQGYNPEHLNEIPDIVVIGNAISRGNPEVEEVLNKKLRYTSLPEIIREFFIRGNKSVVVTGTHGKSTTTGLIAHIFRETGFNPGYILGGVLQDLDSGSKVGEGKHFIIEGDEYDTAFFDKHSKFLHYLPDCVVINAIEFDHADIFKSIDDIIISFKRLINIIPSNGFLIINGQDEIVNQLSQFSFAPVKSFGFSKEFTLSGENFKFAPDGSTFDLYRHGKFIAEVKTRLLGYHNVQNTLAALTCAFSMGVPEYDAIRALNNFTGVKRRLELVVNTNWIKVYNDFAHHPTSIKVTLEALRLAYPEDRIIAIIEPRSNTMVTNRFEKALPSSFTAADAIIISGIHRSEKTGEETRLNIEAVCREIRKTGKKAYNFDRPEEIINFLEGLVNENDVLVFMSNGDFGGIVDKFTNKILKNN